MKKPIQSLIVILSVTLAVMVVIAVFVTTSTRSRVTELRQEIKQQGDPLYLVDFEGEPIQDDSNLYFHLTNAEEDLLAFDDFLRLNFNGAAGPDLRDPKALTPSDIDTLVKGIQEHQKLFAKIDRMAASEQYQADLDLEQGISVSLQHLNLCKSVKATLDAKTISDVSQQKGDDAIRNCIQGLRISSLMMDEPILISFLSALAIERKMLDDAFYVISNTPTSEEVRSELIGEIARSNRKKGIVRALKGERSCGIQTFRDLREGNGNALKGTRVPNMIPGFGFEQTYLNDDESEYISVMNATIENVDKPHTERVQIAEGIVRNLEGSDFRYAVTKLILPAILSATEAVDFNSAKASALIVLLRSQADGELAFENLPRDPFSREPLLAKQTDQGWTVYSVGKNHNDDQGELGTLGQRAVDTPDIGYGPFRVVASAEDAN